MDYLFWVIATGLDAGTLNWTIAVIAPLLITIVTSAFYLLKYGRPL